MHKGDTIPGLITAIFGYSVAIYTLLEDTMRVNALCRTPVDLDDSLKSKISLFCSVPKECRCV